uniref:centrosomal protein of 76 kDa isoform X2 n=1 Tax=Myxine glutinosa TaxID=7769 RepID=UPI00358E81E0
MSLSEEELSELKCSIHEQITRLDVKSKVRAVLDEVYTTTGGRESGIEDLLVALRRRGVVDELVGRLRFDGELAERIEPSVCKPPPCSTHLPHASLNDLGIDVARRHLCLEVQGGRAFLEHLGMQPRESAGTLSLSLHCRAQRCRTRPAPCACEPDLRASFVVQLHSGNAASRMADSASLLAMKDPVQVVLVRTDSAGDTELVSSHWLEWRSVLASPQSGWNTAMELKGVESESGVSVGVLDLHLQLIPPLEQSLDRDVVNAQLALEQRRTAERERLFLVYAKQWWREYLNIRPSHASRLVKIFAQDECCRVRPVCCMIRPLHAARLLDTPLQAARFVSLLGRARPTTLGYANHSRERWASRLAFLARAKGEVQEHAALLCNLLLGFGLDAYMCLGSKHGGDFYAWVMTRSHSGTTTFWESQTGCRFLHLLSTNSAVSSMTPPTPRHPYHTVGCVFNHSAFYANVQPTVDVSDCLFDLSNSSHWKAMSPDVLSAAGTGNGPPPPPLSPPAIDPIVASNELEMQLRIVIAQHRETLSLSTVWDDQLCYLLSPALAAYELERATGLVPGKAEFEDAVRRIVPDGHTFKAFPIHFNHRLAHRALKTALSYPVCNEVLACRGDEVTSPQAPSSLHSPYV